MYINQDVDSFSFTRWQHRIWHLVCQRLFFFRATPCSVGRDIAPAAGSNSWSAADADCSAAASAAACDAGSAGRAGGFRRRVGPQITTYSLRVRRIHDRQRITGVE